MVVAKGCLTQVTQDVLHILNRLNINHDNRIIECKESPRRCVVVMRNQKLLVLEIAHSKWFHVLRQALHSLSFNQMWCIHIVYQLLHQVVHYNTSKLFYFLLPNNLLEIAIWECIEIHITLPRPWNLKPLWILNL